MMFSSRPPFNDDPKPFSDERGNRWIIPATFQPRTFTYVPRPEFDHVQHNPPNPILWATREDGIGYWIDQLDFYGDDLSGGWVGDMKVLPAHIAHARKVLTRLAALEES